MKTHQVFSAESGTPLFEMEIDIDVPNALSEQGMKEDLHHLANELVIDLAVRKRL
jgi:glycine cleavage system regulatory protein